MKILTFACVLSVPVFTGTICKKILRKIQVSKAHVIFLVVIQWSEMSEDLFLGYVHVQSKTSVKVFVIAQ